MRPPAECLLTAEGRKGSDRRKLKEGPGEALDHFAEFPWRKLEEMLKVVPSTHMAAHHLSLQSQGKSSALFWFL